jgi:hypothetical protein
MTEDEPTEEQPDMTSGGQNNPASQAMPYWEQLIEDMDATAAEYRESGWDTIEIHPGDVSTFPGNAGRKGIELLAPDNEFEPAAEMFDEADGFEKAEVYRAVQGNTIYVLVVLEDPATENALLLPAYYNQSTETEFVRMLQQESDVKIHVRPLDERRILTFTHNNPTLFLPGE